MKLLINLVIYFLAAYGIVCIVCDIAKEAHAAPQPQAQSAPVIQAEAVPVEKMPERFEYKDLSNDGHIWLMTDTKTGREYYLIRGYGMVELGTEIRVK